MPSRYSYSARDPRAAAHPLRSLPLSRPASEVFGPTPLQRAEGEARYATNLLAGHVQAYAADRAALGKANRMAPATRRWWQAQALRAINGRRMAIRQAQARLAAAQAALAALQPATATFRVLAQRTGGTDWLAKVIAAVSADEALQVAAPELASMGFAALRATPIAAAPIST